MNKRPLPGAGVGLPSKPYIPPPAPGPAPPLPAGPPPPQPAYPQQDPSAAHAAAWAAYYQVSSGNDCELYPVARSSLSLISSNSHKELLQEQHTLHLLNLNHNPSRKLIIPNQHPVLSLRTPMQTMDTELELNTPRPQVISLNSL